jgi:hypothetical protein
MADNECPECVGCGDWVEKTCDCDDCQRGPGDAASPEQPQCVPVILNDFLSAKRKLAVDFINKNVWCGVNRLGTRDRVIFTVDDLAELIDDLVIELCG